MNASELAREVDLPVPTVHRLVTGKSTRPYPSSLKPIADYFSLNVEQLLGEEPITNEEHDAKQLSTEKIKKIPIVSWNEVTNLNKAIESSDERIVTTGDTSEQSFALVMNDFSMEPLFPKNTILIFDPLAQAIDRNYVLVQLEGKSTPVFRQLLVDLDQNYLKALNPDLNTNQMRLLTKKDKIIACLFESRLNHGRERTL